MRILIADGTIVNERRQFLGSVIVNADHIEDVIEGPTAPTGDFDQVVAAHGLYVLPGVIDSHVHFRDPGLTHKGDINSESRAAAYGGVTAYMDMPNTVPPTISQEELDNKHRIAAQTSHVNYAFFPAATDSNAAFLTSLDPQRVPGIKLFMGSSTGNMAVEGRESLEQIFQIARDKGLILMAHCEDNATIARNMEHFKTVLGTDDPDISYHPSIRSREACYASAALGASLSHTFGTPFHLAHLSTAEELSLLGGTVTGEVCVSYLLFTSDDYAAKGALIKCNPAIKSANDRRALLAAVKEGRISTLSTDHAPHLLSEKVGQAARALSGMPMVQFSLPAMLTLSDTEQIPLTTIVELMCHSPARLFGVSARGFLRRGYKADVTIVGRQKWVVDKACIQSRCGWSPLEGCGLSWQVRHTFCNGRHIYDDGVFDESSQGEALMFNRA